MLERKTLDRKALTEAAHLSDATFREPWQTSMATAFPAMFDTNAGLSVGAYADGKLVAFLGIVPWTIQAGALRLPVFSIGSVCTDPAWRGQGLAGSLVELAFRHAEKAGASLVFVSGNRTLYTRAHCVPFGLNRRFILAPGSAEETQASVSANGLNVRELQPEDWHRVWQLCEQRSSRFLHSISELIRLAEAEAFASVLKLRQKLLVAEREGELVGFLTVGLPATADGKATALEWAGAPDAVHSLLRYAASHRPLSITVPWHEQALSDRLAPAFEREEPAPGTVRIVNADYLLNRLQTAAEDHPTAARISVIPTGQPGEIVLQSAGKQTRPLSPERLAELLFHPQPDWDAIAPEQELQAALRNLAPVPLPSPNGFAFT